jgi:hypothetical protein
VKITTFFLMNAFSVSYSMHESLARDIKQKHLLLRGCTPRHLIKTCKNKGKGKVVVVLLTEHHAMKAYCGSGSIAEPILSTRHEMWSASRPGRFTPWGRSPFTHWIGGWVGPRAGLDMIVKRKIPSPCWDSNPRSSSP